MTNTQTVILSFAGILLTALAGIYATRSARKANQETSQIAGWKDLVGALREDVTHLRSQQDLDEKKHTAEIEKCNSRISNLTERFEKAEDSRKALAVWVRRVAVPILNKAGIDYPAPPIPIDETNPRLRGYNG